MKVASDAATRRNLVHLRRVVGGTVPPGGSATEDEAYDLAGADHDIDRWTGVPHRSYLLCSSPRSGSTLLAEALHFTGLLGSPLEYFDPTNTMAVVWQRWRCGTLGEYIDALHRHRCSPSGVFGMKVHWFQLESLARLEGSGDPVESTHRLLERVAPRCRCVRMTRRDRTRQALSWARAERTEHWVEYSSAADPSPTPPIADAEIEGYERRLEEEDRQWSKLLDRLAPDVLTVAYEELADDHPGTVARVARWLGCPLQPSDVAPPRLQKQSDDEGERMVRRYRRTH